MKKYIAPSVEEVKLVSMEHIANSGNAGSGSGGAGYGRPGA